MTGTRAAAARWAAEVVLASAAVLALAACGTAARGSTASVPSFATGSSAPDPAASHPPGEPIGSVGPIGLEAAGLPTLAPDSVLQRVPTRVRIAALHVDLPVVAPPDEPNPYPACDVAEFLPTMSRPGRPGTTFLYAHARAGMFLPILEASRIGDGAGLLGMAVEVWTSDDRRFRYAISAVRRHVTSLDDAFRATAEQLILQTSEGPHGTIPKTMVIATPLGDDAADHAAAHPTPHQVPCGP